MQQTIGGQRSMRWAVLALVVSLIVTVMAVAPAEARDDPKGADTSNGLAVETEAPARQAPDQSARARVAVAPGTTKALEAMQRRIAKYVATHGTEHTFASYISADTGRIVLETDAPAAVMADLTAMTDTEQARALSNAEVRRTTTSDAWHRRDDIPWFWGGAGITNGSGTCSSGYAVQTSSGYRYSVTAGHCFADWTHVQTESRNNTYGWVWGRRLPTVTGHAMDMELMYGANYAGRIFTGGIFSTSSAGVAAAGSAYVNYNDYCHSGRTTGEHCGHTATSINGQVCTSSGCKSPVIVFNGGTLPQPGDSGGPFYAKDTSGRAWIRGHVIAIGGGTAYAQPWTTVASQYGVSIVTG